MKLKRIIVFLICLGVFISGIVLLVDADRNSPEVQYWGEVIFETVEEYKEFKLYMLSPEVKLMAVDVLASEPPIWIRYSIIQPRNQDFPYRYESTLSSVSGGIMVGLSLMIAFGGGAAGGTGIWAFAKEEE